MNRDELRAEMKRIKKAKTLSEFKDAMDRLHTNAYYLAVKHYTEAAEIVLTSKQQKMLHEKAEEIRELWDGIQTVRVEDHPLYRTP